MLQRDMIWVNGQKRRAFLGALFGAGIGAA